MQGIFLKGFFSPQKLVTVTSFGGGLDRQGGLAESVPCRLAGGSKFSGRGKKDWSQGEACGLGVAVTWLWFPGAGDHRGKGTKRLRTNLFPDGGVLPSPGNHLLLNPGKGQAGAPESLGGLLPMPSSVLGGGKKAPETGGVARTKHKIIIIFPVSGAIPWGGGGWEDALTSQPSASSVCLTTPQALPSLASLPALLRLDSSSPLSSSSLRLPRDLWPGSGPATPRQRHRRHARGRWAGRKKKHSFARARAISVRAKKDARRLAQEAVLSRRWGGGSGGRSLVAGMTFVGVARSASVLVRAATGDWARGLSRPGGARACLNVVRARESDGTPVTGTPRGE